MTTQTNTAAVHEESEGYKQAAAQLSTLREMVDEYRAADEAQDDEAQESARQRIEEDPLTVDVRSDWQSACTTLTPAEFRILLCTGGPAVQIIGDLNEHGEPETARLQHQDWFTPWVDYPADDEEVDAMLCYARLFYFGE